MDDLYNDYLAHHGILGQRWGVRRYQNRDGTLTSQGKKRYEKQLNSDQKKISDYETYKKNYEASDRSAKKELSPTQYARWYTSGARYAQRSRLKKLEKQSKKAEERTRNSLKEVSSAYEVVYNVSTQSYTIR